MFEGMSTIEKEELIVSLATLICADAKVEVTKENLDKLVKESGNKIAPYWTAVFAANCNGKDILDLLAAPGAGAAAAPAAGAAATEAAPAAEEKKEEEEEEEDIDMSGGGLFGDDDDDW
ncbi:ribosomal protein RPP1 [Blastocystis sp. subtype 4]|uniref:ribosomal protein RPP1 n=1 Tax=Blastocystis sp. subtype 4 TaxID=944170 RepID=UPI00071161D5|nr:ribosomal protein RPP1 [Blastocystis sp. subtype 4]KNB45833.1 ribosomal protein RPP1 [Blastocystis sp. subtype 4]|eukprot:XP_014529271.1 ribosomal protein RPP1 [Blastocystis sp. subtype 4]